MARSTFTRRRLEVESFGARGIVAQRRRRTVLDQVGELDDERVRLRGARRSLAPEGEEFLELIERQEWRDEIVARAPEMVALAVKIFPQRFVRPRQGRFHPRRHRGCRDRIHDLMRQRKRAFEVIEPDRNRQHVLLAQGGKETRLDQRSFAQAGHAIEQRQGVAPNQPQQVVDLVAASGKEAAVAFGERSQPDPGMLRVGPLGAADSFIGRRPSGGVRGRCR